MKKFDSVSGYVVYHKSKGMCILFNGEKPESFGMSGNNMLMNAEGEVEHRIPEEPLFYLNACAYKSGKKEIITLLKGFEHVISDFDRESMVLMMPFVNEASERLKNFMAFCEAIGLEHMRKTGRL